MFKLDRQQGFGLTEALIAVVVLGFGILAIVKLQGNFLKGGTESKARTVALSLAQEKLDDLRGFEQLSSDPAKFDFLDIGNDAGGAIAADNSFTDGNTVVSNVDYIRTWTVDNGYYVNGALTYTAPTLAPPFPDQKRVTVEVSWQDQTNTVQSVTLQGVLSAVPPSSTQSLIDDGGANRPTPQAAHTPGTTPEVIPIELGPGQQKETSKPEPEVSTNDRFVETTFDEITYEDDLTIVRREDFKTVNCECKLSATQAEAFEPSRPDFLKDHNGSLVLDAAGMPILVDRVGEKITKRVGTRISTGQSRQQSELCDICCRDHHDHEADANPVDYSKLYDPFRPLDSTHYPSGIDGDHGHFYPDGNGDLQPANNANANDTYLEACRLKRIDGFWRVMQDWRLESLKVMPSVFLQGNDAANYQDYVKQFVKDYAQSDFSEYAQNPPSPDTSFDNEPDNVSMTVNEQQQFIARGIYIDFMSSDMIQTIQGLASGGALPDQALRSIPFHETNLTLLANWSSDPSSGATVTNEPLQDNNTHSRGLVTALEGTPEIAANIERTNIGLTDTRSINPHDNNQANFISDAITLLR